MFFSHLTKHLAVFRNRKNRNDAPTAEDGSMIFEESSLDSLGSSVSIADDSLDDTKASSAVAEGSKDPKFFDYVSSTKPDKNSAEKMKQKKKRKKKKKEEKAKSKMAGDGLHVSDEEESIGSIGRHSGLLQADSDTVVSMLSLEDSFGGGSIGSLTTVSDFTDRKGKHGGKKRRRKKKKKDWKASARSFADQEDNSMDSSILTDERRGGIGVNENVTNYVNGEGRPGEAGEEERKQGGGNDALPINSFEFIDDLSLASSMGTVIRSSREDDFVGYDDDKTDGDDLEGGGRVLQERELVSNENAAKTTAILPAPNAPVKNALAVASTSAKKSRRFKNKVLNRAARLESYLIKKRLWRKQWRISGRGNYDQGAGFTKAAHGK